MQDTTAAAARINILLARAEQAPARGTGSGRAWRKAMGVVNGHGVQVNIFGEDEVQVWLLPSSEPLTVAQAAERLAA